MKSKIKIILNEHSIKWGVISVIFCFISVLFWILLNVVSVNSIIDVDKNSAFTKSVFHNSFLPVIIIFMVYTILLMIGILLSLCFQPIAPKTPIFLVLALIFNCASDICMLIFTQPLMSLYFKLKQEKIVEKDQNLPYQKNRTYVQSFKALILLLIINLIFMCMVIVIKKTDINFVDSSLKYKGIMMLTLPYMYLFASIILSFKNYGYLVKCGLTKPTSLKEFSCKFIPIFEFVATVIIGLIV